MNIPAELRYSKDHEWIRLEGEIAYVGVTDFAQHELGDIVFVDIDTVDETLEAEEVFGAIEAVKTTSDLLMPVAGTVIEFNEGLEESDYEALDMKPLPRNGTIQFREELLYIPGFRELMPVDKDGILSSVRLIPPENTVTISGNPSLLTATKQEIMNYCNIDDEDELEAIMEAIREWKTEKVPLSDGSLDPLLLGRLNNLPRNESGIYTVRISADESDPRPFKRLIFSFQASPVAGPSDKIIQYLQWMYY